MMEIWIDKNGTIFAIEDGKYVHYLKPSVDSPKRFNKCWAEWQAKNNYRL